MIRRMSDEGIVRNIAGGAGTNYEENNNLTRGRIEPTPMETMLGTIIIYSLVTDNNEVISIYDTYEGAVQGAIEHNIIIS